MIKLTLLKLQKYTAILITIQLLLPTLAYKKTSNVDEFMVENERTRMRKNYVHRGLNNVGNHIGVTYVSEPFNPPTKNDELPAFIVDYANMIRNDIILLDNSVETRTRKRGNIKVEKYAENKDIPCSCEQEIKEPIILGDDYFPTAIETRACDKKLCMFPYGCKERQYNITVLKRRSFEYVDEESQEIIPDELKKRLQPMWIAIKKPVVVGCMCVRDY